MRDAVKNRSGSAPYRLQIARQPFVKGRGVDQPDIIETLPRDLGQSLVDRPIDPVMSPVRPDDLRRIGPKGACLAIFEHEQIVARRDPLIVGKAFTPRDDQPAEVAVALQRPRLGIRKTEEGGDACTLGNMIEGDELRLLIVRCDCKAYGRSGKPRSKECETEQCQQAARPGVCWLGKANRKQGDREQYG